jgi:tetratricopeptide (TPR) repeat protein
MGYTYPHRKAADVQGMSGIVRIERSLDENFVERAASPEQAVAAVEHFRVQVEVARGLCAVDRSGDNLGILGRELVRLADALRLADAVDEARDALVEALQVWEELDRDRAAFMARMKLADVEERGGCVETALTLWDGLMDESERAEVAMYRDFVLFGRGVCLWRQGRCREAVADLEAALDARQTAGRARLVAVTQAALARARGDL